MGSFDNKLTALQRDFLSAFFQHEQRFFLSGGAALVGFYLGHRTTHDLDLFTLTDVLSRSEIRDLVDMRALESAGHPVERALPAPAKKNGGLTPARVAEHALDRVAGYERNAHCFHASGRQINDVGCVTSAGVEGERAWRR